MSKYVTKGYNLSYKNLRTSNVLMGAVHVTCLRCKDGMSETTIPKVQRACLLPQAGAGAVLVSDHPVVQPSELLPGQCLVKLTHSGVCHSDLFEPLQLHLGEARFD